MELDAAGKQNNINCLANANMNHQLTEYKNKAKNYTKSSIIKEGLMLTHSICKSCDCHRRESEFPLEEKCKSLALIEKIDLCINN